MCNIALLTGRGGSSLKDKNTRLVRGRPICSYPCIAANRSSVFDHTFCSSDSDDIINIARAYGFRPIKRPEELSTDDAKHVDVINHALQTLNEQHIKPAILTILMANTATLSSLDIKTSVEFLNTNKDVSSVVPVVKQQDHHPFRARRLGKNNVLEGYFDMDKPVSSNRQELPDNFFLTHAFWTIRLTDGKLPFGHSMSPWEFLGNNCHPLEVTSSIDIHETEDFLKTEKWLAEADEQFEV